MQNDLNVEEKRGEMVVDLTRKRVREDEVLDVPDEVGAPEPKKKKKAPRSRNWFGTLNNPTDDDDPMDWDHVEYIVFQLEVSSTGVPHYQGYVQFAFPMQLATLKVINSRAHWEPRYANHFQAKKYCMKDHTRVDGPWEGGDERLCIPYLRRGALGLDPNALPIPEAKEEEPGV